MLVDPAWFMQRWLFRDNYEIGAWWVRRWAYDFCVQLKSNESPQAWTEIIAATRHDLDAAFLAQAANPLTAGFTRFAVDLVETVNMVPRLRGLAPRYLIRVALTFDELLAWQGKWPPPVPATLADPGVTSGPAAPEVPVHGLIPLQYLPREWGDIMLSLREAEVVRDLYRIIHKRAERAIAKAVSESRDLAEWREAMALQIISRASQHIVPLTDSALGIVGGETELARNLFRDGELESLRKVEAYAAEQLAHLREALDRGCYEQAYIDELVAKVRESSDDPFETRRALRAGRGRYKVPPFLLRELDQYLKIRGTSTDARLTADRQQ
jgi:hypothetical protein